LECLRGQRNCSGDMSPASYLLIESDIACRYKISRLMFASWCSRNLPCALKDIWRRIILRRIRGAIPQKAPPKLQASTLYSAIFWCSCGIGRWQTWSQDWERKRGVLLISKPDVSNLWTSSMKYVLDINPLGVKRAECRVANLLQLCYRITLIVHTHLQSCLKLKVASAECNDTVSLHKTI
jgi:hypothetical protein